MSRLKYQRSIVQLQLFQSITQVIVIGILYRIQTAVYHRCSLAVTGQRFFGRIIGICYGIAYACILNVFDAGSKEAYLALLQLINIDNARFEVTDLGNIKFAPVAIMRIFMPLRRRPCIMRIYKTTPL